MRGNSGFLRRSSIFGCLFLALTSTVYCGPARHRRMMRETFTFNTSSQEKEINFSNETGSDLCNHNGKEVSKSSVTCELKSGCRPIQTYGACCPEYQCDCKRDDKIYENGEKIVDPENPCRVCVCRGGEMSCSTVTCYNRNDCKPKFIVGRCCPEYDNCPILENVHLGHSKEVFDTSTSDASNKFHTSTTTKYQKSSEEQQSSSAEKSSTSTQLTADNPLGIKIKEITKTGEIRITDDRPKIFKPTRSNENISAKFLITTTERVSSQFENDISFSSTISNNAIENLSSDSIESKELEASSKAVINSAETVSDVATNKLDATLPTHFEDPHELETAYTNTKGDSSEGTKNIRQADNATNNVWKMDPSKTSSSSEERVESSTSEASPASSTTSDYSSTADPNVQENESDENKKHDPVVFVVDHSGQRKSIVVIDADGLQKVDEPIEDTNDSKGNRKIAIEKVFIVHANTESTTYSSSSTASESSEQQGSSTIMGTSSTSADMETDAQVFETQFYESITSSPFDTSFASKEMSDGETHHSTKGPLPLSSSSEENVQSDQLISDLSTSGFVVLDSITDRSSAASQQSFDAQYYGTEGPDDHAASYDSKYYSNEQIEGSSSPYEFSLFSRLSTALSEGTSEPTMDISSGDVESEDELSNPFENPEFPLIPDDLSIHGMMDDDHDVISSSSVSKQQSIKEEHSTQGPLSSAERILVEVLPLRSNASVNLENNSIDASSSMAPEEWLKSTDDSKSDNNNNINIESDEKLKIISSPVTDSSQLSTSDSSRSSSFGSGSYEDYTPSSSYENLSVDDSKQQYIEEKPLNKLFMDTAKDFFRFQNKMFLS